MSPLSLVHVAAALLAFGFGSAILALRKGDRRHRLFGWAYVGLMSVGLVAILVRGATTGPTPFHGYAVIIAGSIAAAILASRFRSRISGWRTWHAVLMSFSMLAAIVAIGGVVGGIVMGLGKGPAYYQMFNVVIVVITVAGLWLINTRPVIWGRQAAGRNGRIRLEFTILVLVVSTALVLAQWALFQ